MQLSFPLRLLVVDDSEEDAVLAVNALERAGIQCAWARVEDDSGLQRELDAAPDAVICDHQMPQLTVALVAQRVSWRDPDCPIIVVSGKLDDTAGVRLINGLCRDFVRKDALDRLPAAVLREVQAAATRRDLRTATSNGVPADADPIEPVLRAALAEERLTLHFQPQVEFSSGRLVGFEALARWDDPVLGSVPPSRFVAVAERSDLSITLGCWALRSACRQLAAWDHAGYRDLRVSVNLSGRHLTAHGAVQHVSDALSEFGANPRRLQIEITESTLIDNIDRALDAVQRLAALGVQFAIDDFGTGYSSLAYLRRFPIHEIKVDRSFVAEMTERTEDAVIVRTIVAMAHSLGARVVAEGVEKEAQLAALRREHCDIAQGFLIARPAPPEAFAGLLAAPVALASIADHAAKRVLLIVDDEPNIASSLKRLLRNDGYRILTAQSAAQGFDLLAQNEVGVIISDQRMPVMCGTEFLSRVKSIYPDTVRMVLSGFTDLESVTGAINEGAIYKFLTKPWDDDAVRTTVKEAFERHELRRENQRLGEEARRANRDLSEMNVELELHVAHKTEAIKRQLGLLQMSQNVLDALPLGVIGVDAAGMVAAANRYAVTEFGAAPGASIEDCLPGALFTGLRQACSEGAAARASCRGHRVACVPLGDASTQRCHVLVAVPATLRTEQDHAEHRVCGVP